MTTPNEVELPMLFSGNSHLIEPPNVFTGRVPAHQADDMPQLVPMGDGVEVWVFGEGFGALHRTCCLGGAFDESAWRTDVENFDQLARLDQLRPGCFDAAERVKDMDADGVAVTICTSSPAGMGFAGDLFAKAKDPEIGLAAMRAWNDWYHDEWIGAAPTRFVPVGSTWYLDPKQAALEVERNAERGFRGVALRNPTDLGQPWLGSEHWDPFFRACEETQTVIVHHTEGLEWFPRREGHNNPYPYGMHLTLYQAGVMDFMAAALWGGLTVRFPKLRILVAESGGSWIPHLLRRLNFNVEHSPLTKAGWPEPEMSPLEMIKHTFTFSTQELDVATELEAQLGITSWMTEDDYPHIESVWPNTAAQFAKETAGFDPDLTERLAWRTGSELFRFPMPNVQPSV